IVSVFENDGDLLSIESDVLEDFRNMARPVGRSIKAAALFFSGQRLELTREIFDRVDRALAVADECEGAMQGMLEQINIHGGANLFHIFPEIGPSKIACSFPSRLYDDAVSSVGRMVEVQGTLKFRARASFPHQISVSCIETFPPEDALPSWDDIRGRAPDCTDGMSSEEYVRSLRNAWR
ncbi:MAG: hypothetical protein NT133_22695, partial [Alphaproteobacteria bacterium]|nr:hypothetical protein [Alphaproteobacteria bacterium]